ncbi:MAG: phage portal protein [Candidatus Limiplasma sp.]|nr:phage portal protein [Candidatus Limiplasma sp.]
MITLDKDLLLPTGEPDGLLLTELLRAFETRRTHLEELRKIYDRDHKIEARQRLKGLPNNRLVHDLPGYIVITAAGYLLGSPVTYAPPQGQEAAFEAIKEAYTATDSESLDAELAVNASVYGVAVELTYADEEAQPKVAQIDPRSAFVVYDDTVNHAPLLGIVILPKLGRDLQQVGQRITVYTPSEAISYERIGQEQPRPTGERTAHFFGAVPLVEYWNNSREQGDFEPVLSLIDAYDVLQSDRVNDKQQFTDSILALYGIGALGVEDAPVEMPEGDEESPELPKPSQEITPAQRLRQTRTLFMPGDNARAEWLVKPPSEADTEVLRESLKEDIHKLSFVPDMSDQQFAGNTSGVAMRFKLLGLEQVTKIKERWFREGLRQRLRLFAHFLALRGAAALDADRVEIRFKRALPANELEIAQMVSYLSGLVPAPILLGQVPFVEDPEAAAGELERERQAAMERQQRAFGEQAFREEEKPKEKPDDTKV